MALLNDDRKTQAGRNRLPYDLGKTSGANPARTAVSTPIWEPSFDTALLTSRPSGSYALEIATAIGLPTISEKLKLRAPESAA